MLLLILHQPRRIALRGTDFVLYTFWQEGKKFSNKISLKGIPWRQRTLCQPHCSLWPHFRGWQNEALGSASRLHSAKQNRVDIYFSSTTLTWLSWNIPRHYDVHQAARFHMVHMCRRTGSWVEPFFKKW